MTVQELRERGWIILECVSGSHMYGLATETSDKDIRGVFVLPTEEVLKGNYIEQVNDDSQDTVFYEVGRFLHLLEKGNPNILELLNCPEDCIIYKHPDFDTYFPDPKKYLSKQLYNSFTGYAHSQIEKARGLNKKINNPQPIQRKDLLDFCYILMQGKSIPFWKFFTDKIDAEISEDEKKKLVLEYSKNFGLVKYPNGKQLYALYFMETEGKQILKDLNSTELVLRSISKEEESQSCLTLWYNIDGFQCHCKEYREYHKWVEERNPQRYQENTKADYDLKNMMHCVRLLEMSLDIFKEEKLVVRRPNREYLLDIRKAKFSYEEIMDRCQGLLEEVKTAKDTCSLPDKVSRDPELLLRIRRDYDKKPSPNFYEDLKNYFENTSREKVLEDWEKVSEFDETGVVIKMK